MERYEAILRDIQAHVPGVKLTLLAYYPLCEPKLAEEPHGREILKSRNNRTIAQANQAVRALAKKVGAGFLNCNSAITDESGNMHPEYTIEGMHMYGAVSYTHLDVYKRQAVGCALAAVERAKNPCSRPNGM